MNYTAFLHFVNDAKNTGEVSDLYDLQYSLDVFYTYTVYGINDRYSESGYINISARYR